MSDKMKIKLKTMKEAILKKNEASLKSWTSLTLVAAGGTGDTRWEPKLAKKCLDSLEDFSKRLVAMRTQAREAKNLRIVTRIKLFSKRVLPDIDHAAGRGARQRASLTGLEPEIFTPDMIQAATEESKLSLAVKRRQDEGQRLQSETLEKVFDQKVLRSLKRNIRKKYQDFVQGDLKNFTDKMVSKVDIPAIKLRIKEKTSKRSWEKSAEKTKLQNIFSKDLNGTYGKNFALFTRLFSEFELPSKDEMEKSEKVDCSQPPCSQPSQRLY